MQDPPPFPHQSNTFSGWHRVTCNLSAAMFWYGYGLPVIPISPSTKITAVKWDPWLEALSPQKINEYWTENPTHEVGFIVGDDMIVFDADDPESIAAISEIEARFGLTSKLVVKTTKGEHHYFRRTAGTMAKSDSHSSEKHPDRLDIKTGRALVILPPSTGKNISTLTVNHKSELSEAPQEFIDAVNLHNGRSKPSQSKKVSKPTSAKVDEAISQKIEALLKDIDPDCSYEDWLHVGMAIFHETRGSDEGQEIFDRWSSQGDKYKGEKDIETKWRSFQADQSNPVTIGTLIKMATDAGADVSSIIGNDAFQICKYEVVTPDTEAPKESFKKEIQLKKYSLQGLSAVMEEEAVNQVYVLDSIALLGQAIAIYAAPNSGKTLFAMKLTIESITKGSIDPSQVYFINADDTHTGLLEKLRIAEEYGFHMLAEGYNDFKLKNFEAIMESMVASDTARGVVIILDTLKKFTDLMNKRVSSSFGKIVRSFVMKGGTVIGLAHTNKHPGSDGKPIHSGTNDVLEDFDCAYILDTVSEEDSKRVVEFRNIKRRGNVALSVSYCYALENDISYNELLLSVQKVDEDQLAQLKQAAKELPDTEVITTIEACITDGINTKMKLAEATAERTNGSKRKALKIIEKYTGDDPSIHRWNFSVGAHGANIFKKLERPEVLIPARPAPKIQLYTAI